MAAWLEETCISISFVSVNNIEPGFQTVTDLYYGLQESFSNRSCVAIETVLV